MADTRSPLLDLLLMETGGQDNTWGDSHNDEVTLLIEQAIVGYDSIAVDGGTDALTTDQARNAMLRFTGTLLSNQIVQVPELSKAWLVYVGVTGNFTTTFRVGAAGATVELRQSGWQVVWTDGTNIYAGPSSAQFDTQFRAPAGSAAAPGIAGLSDTDTGIEFAGSDVMYFVSGGTRRFRLEADGDLRAANGDELWLTLGATSFGESLVNLADAAALRSLAGLGTAALRDSPGTTVDNTVPRFDGVTGNFQTSGVTISDANSITGVVDLTLTGALSAGSIKAAVRSAYNLKIDNGDTGGSNLTNRMRIRADEAVLGDSSGNKILLSAIDEVINFTTTGAGGLQSGGLANSSGYHLYLIYNSTTLDLAGFAHIDSASLTLPSGYDKYIRVGWAPTNGSAQLHRIQQRGNRTFYKPTSGGATTSLRRIAGPEAAGNVNSSYEAETVVQFVPPTAVSIILSLTCTSIVMVAPNNTGYGFDQSFAPYFRVTGSSQESFFTVDMPLESTNIYWAANASNGSMYALGWVDSVNAG